MQNTNRPTTTTYNQLKNVQQQHKPTSHYFPIEVRRETHKKTLQNTICWMNGKISNVKDVKCKTANKVKQKQQQQERA